MAEDLAIDVKGMTKRFDDRTVVNQIDLQVRAGEIYGFLGPNGSGDHAASLEVRPGDPRREHSDGVARRDEFDDHVGVDGRRAETPRRGAVRQG